MSDAPSPLVLIVDDTPNNVRLLASILEGDYEIAIAVNGEQALDMARELPPDLVLLDVMLPDLEGFEVCRRLKAEASTEAVPVIFLTAKSETEDIVGGFGAGGVDYVTKPFLKEELLARVAAHIRLRRLMIELEAKNQELLRLSMTDALTGIPNRRFIMDRLEEAIRLARRYGFPVAALMLDIDHFKRVNDSFGHLAGDEALRRIASIASGSIRETDFLGRYGGEEFLVCLPYTDLGGARLAAEKIRAAIASLAWPQEGLKITVSGGLALLAPADEADDLISRADAMLYEAKLNGRDRIC